MLGLNKKYRSGRSGLALVSALWVSALMIALVSVAAQTSLLDSSVSQVEIEKQRCRWAARGGIETAIALLLEDERDVDGLTDLWADNPAELESLPMDGVTLTVRIADAAAKLNANTTDISQFVWLPDMTEDIAESILDWIDGDDDIRAGGAESGYYLNLKFGYWARNSRLRTTRELLRVRGVEESFFYGDPERGPLSADNDGWIYYLTCWSRSPNTDGSGGTRVNVNRADAQTLQNVGFSEPQARWIVENRPFRSLAELSGKSGGTSPQPSAQPAQPSAQPAQPQNQPSSPQTGQRSRNGGTAQGGAQNPPPAAPPDWNTVLANVDELTVTGRSSIRGQLNINTAGLIVLTAFFEGNRELAEAIIAARQSRGGAFMTLSELGQVAGMSETILKKFIDRLTVRSSVFEITATAVSDATGLNYRLEAVVNRDLSNGEIYYWREGINP